MLYFVLSDAVQKSPQLIEILIEILFELLMWAKNNPHILFYWDFLTKVCGVCVHLYRDLC